MNIKDKNEKTRAYYEDMPVDFKRDGRLMQKKLLGYLPAMIITNLSNLLLTTVDGLVVGNLLGNDAFASVNVFEPVTVFFGAITVLAATGIATCLANAIGSNRQDEINRIRGASFQFMMLMIVFISVIQVPMVNFIINSYNLSPEMNKMVWQYAIGIMICAPLGTISTIGVYQLQIVGKMKILMMLSVIEGITNLLLDLLFVGIFNMGVAGAGYGTACANLVRASITVIYLSRYTNIYKRNNYKTNIQDFMEILRAGLPDCIRMLMATFQAYCLIKILLTSFGTNGGVVKGVVAFCFSLVSVLINGLQGSMRPLVGLLSGANDKVGLRKIMKTGFRLCIIGGSISMIVVMLFPSFFYNVNGIRNIPDGGDIALRLISLSFIVEGFNILISLFLVNRKDNMFVSRLNLIGYAFLPATAFIISKMAPGPWLWACYVICYTLMFTVLYWRYLWWGNKDIKEDYKNGEEMVLYMTVTPAKAITASRAIRKFANDYDINPRISNRVALCMEEMVAYASSINDNSKIKARLKNTFYKISKDMNITIGEFSVQIMVRFKGKNDATFTMLDDGYHIELDTDEEERWLTISNYELIRKLAKSFNYQNILDMNYATIEFEYGYKRTKN